ncbi:MULTISPECIES: DoxX family membrane protein [unclassified Tolypothrix]|uniref:DoxX family membrane protein n=1 Tax=unclassified Tolypothrix TaxID=2649714 RepID=UPI0005F7FD0A|nr:MULTISPECIES: DoxX family membrane protein [unclassified Tolypothrix]MBE9083202.1 DoxX family membrane protein [Tolypothrix sp. LEGE 11397]UYD23989.1 DoxX family membrane protein [Tolypothrix sp. PCC 7712]UYD33782.1 DoxX family membrane protein [Tolypothrix sp. PCC 7601]BAY89728.1 DoxX protein [Microchaete diplosiphon NIES-3275]
MRYLLNLRTAVSVNRIIMGLFFFVSGIANYLNFNVANGFYQTVITQKLQIIGPGIPPGWEGIGPLPSLIAIPYAWLLPLAEILVGALFALNYWVRWTGLLLILMTFSIILAFGIIPAGTLFPNGAESFNKNILFMTLIWICIAYDAYEQKMSRRRTEAMANYAVNNAMDDM